jgi:hypothetical protein
MLLPMSQVLATDDLLTLSTIDRDSRAETQFFWFYGTRENVLHKRCPRKPLRQALHVGFIPQVYQTIL